MTLHQLLGTLLFSTLLTAPTIAIASHNDDIDIQTNGLRVQVGRDGGVTINTRALGLNTNPISLSESIYQRLDLDQYQPRVTCHRSSNRSANTYTHRNSGGSTYSQTSVTTQICQ